MAFSKKRIQEETSSFFQKVYGWMFLGLAISGAVALLVASTPVIFNAIFSNIIILIGIVIVELALVIGLSWLIKRIPANLAVIMFLLYSAVTGLTLSVIFLLYTIESIGVVFFITATMFGAISLYGFFTKRDLTGLGPILFMGLIGLIIASLVNLFLNNSVLDYVLSFIGVAIFTGLTAYDTQKIRQGNIIGNEGTEEDIKESVIGALRLYLDFVNLFLDLLRLLGKRRE